MVKNKIYNQDCNIFMKTIMDEQVNLILTSPPYNMTDRKGGDADSGRYDIYQDWKTTDDYLNWTIDIFDNFDKILKTNGVILYNFGYSIENPTLPYLIVSKIYQNTEFEIADTIIWKKPNSMPFPASPNRLQRLWEFVFIFVRKDEIKTFHTNKQISKTSSKNGQKYYKPIFNFIQQKNNDEPTKDINQAIFSTNFVINLLEYYATSDKNFIVYDPFMGTGTTANACILYGCSYLGTEISDVQVNYSIKRLKKNISQFI